MAAIEFAVLSAMCAMLCWGVGDFLIQRTTRRIGDIEALAWIGIVGSIGLLPLVVSQLHLIFSWENFSVLFWLGVLTFFVAVIAFEGFKRGKLSVVDVVLEVELPLTVILGVFFFSEFLSFVQLALIFLIFAGIFLIAMGPSRTGKARLLEKGVLLSLVAAIGMAFMNFLTALGAKNISPLMVIWFPWIVFTLMSLAYIVSRRDFPSFIRNTKKYSKLILGMGIFDTAAWLFYAIALSGKELSITTAITESYPAIALFLGLWINRERIAHHQYWGAAIALVGSIFIGFLV